MVSTQSEVKALLDERSDAMRTRNIDRLMSLYSADVVYFDLVPPLRYAGAAALRDRFTHWFDRWRSAIDLDLSDLHILENGGEIAAAHMLLRASGTLKTGEEVGYWVRTSNFCRRSDQRWLITHEHVSLPVDIVSRRAVMDIVP